MFRKIISNLPFQPALLGQLSAYIKQLQKEVSLRQLGFLVLLVILLVQIFITISPSQSTLTTNSADIIYGASSKDEILQSYINNRDMLGHSDIQDIYNHYGVGEQQIISSKETTITQQAGANTYINTSRNPSNISDTFVFTSKSSNGGVYEFPLSYWGNKSYSALTGMNSFGSRYYILLNGSGNIVFEKGAKSSNIEVSKQIISNPLAKPGDTSIYSIRVHNKGKFIAENTTISSVLPTEFEYQNYKSNADLVFSRNGQQLNWKINNRSSSLAPSTNWVNIDVAVKAKNIQTSEQMACDSTSVSSSNGPLVFAQVTTQNQCIKIKKIACPATGAVVNDSDTKACPVSCPDGSISNYSGSCATPQLTCESLQQVTGKGWDGRTYKTIILTQKGATLPKISYYVNDKLISSEQAKLGADSNYFTYTFPSPGEYLVKSELSAPEGTVQPSQNCAIKETIVSSADEPEMVSKNLKVKNVTKNIANANNTYASKGDTLEYTLTVTNLGNKTIDSFDFRGEFAANISDILEYANLNDNSDISFSKSSNTLAWSPVTIAPGDSIVKKFSARVKNPIPTTPTSKSNPLSYDFVLSSTYGNTVNIKMKKPLSKIIEQKIVNTPNVPIMVSFLLTTLLVFISGYLYIRSRVLVREAEIIHKEYSSGGM